MEKRVNLTIDGREVAVPAGMNIVDAAKTVGIDIPVFCHHPKLKPVGMCRLCLVDVGRPATDRATGTAVLNEDGTPKILYGPKLETACTTPVSEGMVVWGATEKVMAARKEVIEFLLTSHPLDCPVCDKGGECPLQNQTMEFGSSDSRFILDEKKHAKKHVPLGDLIWLDRERCIHCARCVRFEDQVADDPVIGFYNRGRSLEIATFSEPGFDSIFSGNTSDICPVGALTTADFRFGARPWELKHKPSICTKCAVGCNITYDVRREARNKGNVVIKRVMPRQNEEVNEIWLCDKGRFTHTYAESRGRLTQPLLRKNGELIPASWEEALTFAADKLKASGKKVLSLVSGNLSLEDMFAVKTLMSGLGGTTSLYNRMGGGEWVTRVGMFPGSDLSKFKKGSAILVFASDLHEEAPIWWLRVKQAAERGVTVVVAGARKSRLDKFATHQVAYKFGDEEKALREIFEGNTEITRSITGAEDLVVFMGSDGLGLQQTTVLAGSLAERLVKTNHFGKPNNGLIAVWPHANDQGAYELGIQPDINLAETMSAAMGLYILGADPSSEPILRNAIQKAGFVIVQDLFMSETAKLADVVLPAQAVAERDGTLVSGERRAQRYAAAVPAPEDTRADFTITSALLQKTLGKELPATAGEFFDLLCQEEKVFAGLSFEKLGFTREQWPLVGRNEVYYGGTTYENTFGLGVTLPLATGEIGMPRKTQAPDAVKTVKGQWLIVPVTRLYDQSPKVQTSLLKDRSSGEPLTMHPADAEAQKICAGGEVSLKLGEKSYSLKVKIDSNQPQGVALLTRNSGVPLPQPATAEITPLQENERGTL